MLLLYNISLKKQKKNILNTANYVKVEKNISIFRELDKKIEKSTKKMEENIIEILFIFFFQKYTRLVDSSWYFFFILRK